MDAAYNQHANPARRKNRSTTNINHLSLAPLTSKLPINDQDEIPESFAAPVRTPSSYLQGKSAPTTPGLLTRSPTGRSRSHGRSTRAALAAAAAAAGQIQKSKSTTHLSTTRGHNRHRSGNSGSGTATPSTRRRRREEGGGFSTHDRNDSDWLLRAGALISTETRESKGQAWLVSRASSTSLNGPDDERQEAEENVNGVDYDAAGNMVLIDDAEQFYSPQMSRFASRSGSRGQGLTPGEQRHLDEYFTSQSGGPEEEHGFAGPDFVNLDERLEAIERDTTEEDEAHVRKLVKRGPLGSATWLGSMLPWSLWSVQERDEDGEGDDGTSGSVDEGDETDGTALERPRTMSSPSLQDLATFPEDRPAPPGENNSSWQDAAWLLSVASKVIL
jgi:hypothetical protein